MAVTGSDERLVHGTCHHDCPDSCGWTATVRDGVALKLRGRVDHPYSEGELCPKVNRMLDRVYSPDRVLHPLRRTGPKGSGQFERISWDDALAAIAGALRVTIDEHGPEAILPYSSAGNQSLLALMGISARFFHHIGACRLVAALCGPTVGAGVSKTNGSSLGIDPLDLVHSRLILLWGTNTKLTNRHLWPTIERARAAGAKVVVIDPVRTVTADAADEFIRPRPGTDVAMMLAMMHELIARDLVDHDWIDTHTLGYGELTAHVAGWTPERAETITGVPADTIRSLAGEYGTIRPAAIRTLIGAEHHEHGAMFFRSLACLPALVGAWRDRGGGLARSVGSWQERVLDTDALTRPDLLAGRQPRWINMSSLAEALTDPALDPPVKAMIVWGANPMVVIPDADRVRRGMARDDLFTVVHDQFVTDTAAYADIVLPATTQIESNDVVSAWGHLWLGWNEAAIEPQGESCSNSELFRRLARAMELGEPSLYDSDDELISQVLGTQVDVDELRSTGWVKVPYPDDGRPWADGGFTTPSGKVEFVSASLAAEGHPALPEYRPANESPGGDSDLAARYPLQLMAPKHHQRFLNSSYSHLPKHGLAEHGPFVELHPIDAEARGLHDGEDAVVFNDRATLHLPVRVGTRVGPGVALVPWGWWQHQHDDGRSANALTNATLTDWGGGVAFFDTLVQVAAPDTSVAAAAPNTSKPPTG